MNNDDQRVCLTSIIIMYEKKKKSKAYSFTTLSWINMKINTLTARRLAEVAQNIDI